MPDAKTPKSAVEADLDLGKVTLAAWWRHLTAPQLAGLITVAFSVGLVCFQFGKYIGEGNSSNSKQYMEGAAAKARKIVESASQGNKGLTDDDCRSIVRELVPTVSEEVLKLQPTACPRGEIPTERPPAPIKQPERERQDAAGAATTSTKKSGPFLFSFDDIILRPVEGNPTKYQTSVTVNVQNLETEPVELAFNIHDSWPTLNVNGNHMGADNRTMAGLPFLSNTLARCSTPNQQFYTLSPGSAPVPVTVRFLADLPKGALDATKTANLTLALAYRLPTASECIGLPVVGTNIRASFVRGPSDISAGRK